MVYLGLNSNNGSSSSTSGSAGQNKNGSRTPELVDLDTEKPNERNGGKRFYIFLVQVYNIL